MGGPTDNGIVVSTMPPGDGVPPQKGGAKNNTKLNVNSNAANGEHEQKKRPSSPMVRKSSGDTKTPPMSPWAKAAQAQKQLEGDATTGISIKKGRVSKDAANGSNNNASSSTNKESTPPWKKSKEAGDTTSSTTARTSGESSGPSRGSGSSRGAASGSSIICEHYVKGSCSQTHRCRFYHPVGEELEEARRSRAMTEPGSTTEYPASGKSSQGGGGQDEPGRIPSSAGQTDGEGGAKKKRKRKKKNSSGGADEDGTTAAPPKKEGERWADVEEGWGSPVLICGLIIYYFLIIQFIDSRFLNLVLLISF